MKIYPIVEGHAEIEAVPELLRRLLFEMRCYDFHVARPIRRTQAKLHDKKGVQDAVQLVKLHKDCAAMIILFDGEDVCPVKRATQTLVYARGVAENTPCEVVVAYREYETWFLSALESLRGFHGIRDDAVAPENPESRRDSKGWLKEFMLSDHGYSPTNNQTGMTARFNLSLAHRRNRSFRKFVKSVGDIVSQLGHILPNPWPPESWQPNFTVK